MSPSDPTGLQPSTSVDAVASSRTSRTLLWLMLAGLAARAVYLVLEPHCALTGDEQSWLALGVNELGRPNRGLSPLRYRIVFYPPVYPYFIAILTRAFGTTAAVLWAQVVLGAALVPAVGRVGAGVVGRRSGLVAAAIAAFYPELLWYAAHFWSETVFLVLLWWAIERTLAADRQGSLGVALAAGLLWGGATLTRELSLYLVPIVLVWMLRRPLSAAFARARRRRGPAERGVSSRRALAPAAALVVAAVLTIAPWTLRNALVFHAFIPVSTMGGLNLWQGNTTLTHLQIYEVLATKGGAVQQDRFCRAMAWREIKARQPRWVIEKLREQMPEFWKPSSEVLDHIGGRQACGPLSERQIALVELLFVVPYLALIGLFLWGLARLRVGAAATLLLLLLAAYNAAHVAAYATTRFRLPILPVLFVIAAAALAGARDGQLGRLTTWRLALLLLLAALAAAVVAPGLPELSAWRLLAGQRSS